MLFMCLLLVPGADDSVETLAKKMRPIYVQEASDYTIAVESAPKKALELKKEPVFEWSNPTREGLQQGVVFIWLRDGRPAAIGSIFSQPHDKPAGRQIMHEFHLLDPEKADRHPPEGRAERVEAAGRVASEGTGRSAYGTRRDCWHAFDSDEEARRGLHRLHQRSGKESLGLTPSLPTPLYRYPAAKTGVIDGALFTLVSSAGTDPEVAGSHRSTRGSWRESEVGIRLRPVLRPVTFTFSRNDKEIWSSVRDTTNGFNNDPQHLYRLYADKVVNLEGKMLARVKVTDKAWWGEVVPRE